MQSCPSVAASRIPLPYVPLADQNLAADPINAPHRPLSIYESIRIALSNSEAVRNLGLVDAGSDIDIIRSVITVYDPMAAQAAAEGEWGIFDPLWTTSMQWTRQDIPPGTSFSGIGNRPPELDLADFYTSIEQLFPAGTRFRADYVNNYLFNPDRPPTLVPNPQYFSYTQFGVTQPLMQGYGINPTMANIRVAAAEAERTDWQFKQEVLALVRSVETSYWMLYAQQQNLKAIQEVLPSYEEIVRIREEQVATQAGIQMELARARSEMLTFEQRRLATLSLIAEYQLVLRNLMGLDPNDGRYLDLIALPISTTPVETVGDAIDTAINRRPDVLRQRLAVYVAEQENVLARDSYRPKLDFNAFWRVNGLGDDLGDSLDVIGQNDFHDWNLGFTFQVPLGRRKGRANVRETQFLIQRERAMLEQVAHQTAYEVADAYRRLQWLSQQNQVAKARTAALTTWREGAKAQFDNPPAGMSKEFALELYLRNLRDTVDASVNANAILSDFNGALARLEEVKGTLLDRRYIEVMGDATGEIPGDLPLPQMMLPGAATPYGMPCPAPEPHAGESSLFSPPVIAPSAPAGPTLSLPAEAGPAPPPRNASAPAGVSPLFQDPTNEAAKVGSNDLPLPGVLQPKCLTSDQSEAQVPPVPSKAQPTLVAKDEPQHPAGAQPLAEQILPTPLPAAASSRIFKPIYPRETVAIPQAPLRVALPRPLNEREELRVVGGPIEDQFADTVRLSIATAQPSIVKVINNPAEPRRDWTIAYDHSKAERSVVKTDGQRDPMMPGSISNAVAPASNRTAGFSTSRQMTTTR